MAKTDPINIANPPGNSAPSLGDDYIRTLAKAVAEVLGIDHVMTITGNAYDGDDNGKHAKVTLAEVQSLKPTLTANDKGVLYLKGATPEVFIEDSAGNEVQLTNAGLLNVTDASGAVVKTGAQTIAGVKTLSDIPVFSAGINCNSQKAINVLDPTANQDAATKKFVDDSVAAKAFGAWQTNPSGYATSVTASTDGFVCAWTNDANTTIKGFTPVATQRVGNFGDAGAYNHGVTFPVKKGNTWKVTGASVVYWLPFGA